MVLFNTKELYLCVVRPFRYYEAEPPVLYTKHESRGPFLLWAEDCRVNHLKEKMFGYLAAAFHEQEHLPQ